MTHTSHPFLLLLLLLLPAACISGDTNFIKVKGMRFVEADTGADFVFSGWNTWSMLETAAGFSHKSTSAGRSQIEARLRFAASLGLKVVRVFGHGSLDKLALQAAPSKYNHNMLEALDFILDAAHRTGVRVLLTLTDNWRMMDGKRQYVKWVPSAHHPDDFYTNKKVQGLFQNHIIFLTNRKNSVNGRVYQDDPTIFAWDLMNEPRCECSSKAQAATYSCSVKCTHDVQTWIENMSAFLKRQDPNHLVTVGEEGFWGHGDPQRQHNPDATAFWSSRTGQDFTNNHAPASIDFAAIHSWPDNWKEEDVEFQQQWIQQHVEAARKLGKPLLLEEFGKEVPVGVTTGRDDVRRPFFTQAYKAVMDSIHHGGPLRGLMFWEWAGALRDADAAYSILDGDATFQKIIKPFTAQIEDYEPRIVAQGL